MFGIFKRYFSNMFEGQTLLISGKWQWHSGRTLDSPSKDQDSNPAVGSVERGGAGEAYNREY
jgi:hypothetical protein